jgi:hypothetical protein
MGIAGPTVGDLASAARLPATCSTSALAYSAAAMSSATIKTAKMAGARRTTTLSPVPHAVRIQVLQATSAHSSLASGTVSVRATIAKVTLQAMVTTRRDVTPTKRTAA